MPPPASKWSPKPPAGKALRRLIPVGADLAVPEHFYVEVAGVLRRWEHANVLTAAQAAVAVEQLVRWPLRRATVVALLPGAWAYRHNLTIGDGLYVELADRLGASLITDDHRLVNAPTFPAHIPTLTIP